MKRNSPSPVSSRGRLFHARVTRRTRHAPGATHDLEHDLSWDEVHHALVPLMRVDNRTNILYIAREYALLIPLLVACYAAHGAWADGRLTTPGFAALAALGVALVGALQHRLSGLAHDASHYTLFRNRLANDLVSDLFLMFPIVAFTQTYRSAHLGHHQYVNDPERDPDWRRLETYEPMRFPIPRARFLVRYVLRGLWPPSILRYLFGRAKAANLGGQGDRALRSPYRFRVARTMRGPYWLALLTLVHALHAWPVFWLFWVLPLLTAYPFYMLLREIAHHANAPDAGDLTNSRVFRVHPLLQWAVFPYGQSFHLTHHLFAMIPHHRLAAADRLLRRYPPYRDQVVVCRGYFLRSPGSTGPTVLDALALPRPAEAS